MLEALPLTAVVDGFTLCHGSLRDPLWEYVTSPEAATATLRIARTDYCCNGHTHVPALFTMRGDIGVITRPPPETPQQLQRRSLLNPGSVGQPRDGDPRAAYAVIDTDAGTATFYRASYRIDETQRRIRARGLPEMFADRLAFGV
jgi:diadenosine tetraphosphatase ApaH/serine/threonine PP2A family protein phosphatase